MPMLEAYDYFHLKGFENFKNCITAYSRITAWVTPSKKIRDTFWAWENAHFENCTFLAKFRSIYAAYSWKTAWVTSSKNRGKKLLRCNRFPKKLWGANCFQTQWFDHNKPLASTCGRGVNDDQYACKFKILNCKCNRKGKFILFSRIQ